MLLKFFIVVLFCGLAFGKTFEKWSRDDPDVRRDEVTDDSGDDSRLPDDPGKVSTILIKIRSL